MDKDDFSSVVIVDHMFGEKTDYSAKEYQVDYVSDTFFATKVARLNSKTNSKRQTFG